MCVEGSLVCVFLNLEVEWVFTNPNCVLNTRGNGILRR